jgi:AAA family ATP:ADP antiporter
MTTETAGTAGQGRLPWRSGELAPTLTAFAAFASLLCGYYLLRPVRDAWAIERGTSDLRYFFLYTFVAMLLVLPIYWWLVRRSSRRAFLSATFVAVSATTLIFALALATSTHNPAAAGAFFVFLSVINLFMVSIFWSVMADLFDSSQAPRLFGVIAGGGSAGAILGPALASTLVHGLGPAGLLAIAAAMFLIGLGLIRVMLRGTSSTAIDSGRAHITGARAIDDLLTLVRSSYVLGIVLMLVISQIAANLVYNEQARAVGAAYANLTDRAGLFASIDLWVNCAALVLQLLIGHALVRRFGFRMSLTLMPVLAALSFLGLGIMPTLTMLIATQIVRRAGEYGLFRPARETLFTVVSDSVKYRSKSLTDTVIHRGADALGAFLHRALSQFGVTLPGMAFACVALCGAIIGIAAWLGREFQRYAGTVTTPSRPPGEATT